MAAGGLDEAPKVREGGVDGATKVREQKDMGGMDGEMELGGVGSSIGCILDGAALAVTAAKVSLPVQNPVSRGFGISTEAVIPANAVPAVEVVLTIGAMVDAE